MTSTLDAVEPTEDLRPGFERLYQRAIDELLPAFALVIDDVGLADAAIREGLIWVRRRGPRSMSLPQVWQRAFRYVTSARWPRRLPDAVGPNVFAEAASDEPLVRAIGELPIRQRSALVCAQVLGWNELEVAEAHDVAQSTIDLRRRRALGELAKVPGGEDPHVIAEALRDLQPASSTATRRDQIVRSARFRTLRSRALALAAAALCIGLVGLALRPSAATAPQAAATPGQVDPPRETQAPHAPIGDGRGGFVAYARSGGVISTSDDGESWAAVSRLNVDRIDLRLFAQDFFRSNGRYVMLIDSTSGGGRSFSSTDQPRIAISDDLVDWTILRVDLGPLPAADGLHTRIDLLSAAVVGDRVLAAVSIDQQVDHRRLGVTAAEICTTTDDREGLVLHLCDGTAIPVAERGPAVTGTDHLYASERGATFSEVPVDDSFNPFGLVAFGDRFAMLEPSSDQLYVSDTGRSWEPFFDLGVENRLGLIEATDDSLLLVSPNRGEWTSNLLDDERVITGSLPLGLDPTTIWLKPQISSGPAGFALFVTTSRPWERRDDTVSGWAVHVDDWLIEQRPERESIRLRSLSSNLRYEYHSLLGDDGLVLDHPHVQRGEFGGVRLFHPATGALLVDVTGEQIRDSWVTGTLIDQNLTGVRTEALTGDLEQDGWRLTGNIRTGPLVLVGPDGTERRFDDGFVLTNGSVDDGAESTVTADRTDGRLEFFTDGVLDVSFAATDVLEALDPEPATDPDQPRAMVLFSPDGVQWEPVWQSSRATWYGSVAVGDDELLLSTAGFSQGPVRLPLDQSDS